MRRRGSRSNEGSALLAAAVPAQHADEARRTCDATRLFGRQRPLLETHHLRRYTLDLTIGDTAPDFTAETTEGEINFHEWIGDSWAVLFSHPRDFTPVCTTELGYMASIKPEFDARGTKIIGISVDPVVNHDKWAADI